MAEDHTDTSPEAADLQRELFGRLDGGERVRMACAMFDTARRLVLASLSDDVRSDPAQRRAALLRRFYERELGADVIRAVLDHWAATGAAAHDGP